MNNIRWTTLSGPSPLSSTFLGASTVEDTTDLPGGNHGVDEVVFNPSLGTLASFQEPPNLAKLLNGEAGSCSIVI